MLGILKISKIYFLLNYNSLTDKAVPGLYAYVIGSMHDLSIYLSVCLSIYYLSISVCLSIYYLSISLSIYLSILSACLSACLSIYLTTYVSIYLSVYLSVYLSLSIYLSIHPPIHPSSYLSIYLSTIYLSIYYLSIYLLSIYLSIYYLSIYYLSIYLSICLSIYLSVCLSVYLSIYLFNYPCLYSCCGLWLLSQFLNLHTVGTSPWTVNQHVARPLPTHRTTQTQRKRTSGIHVLSGIRKHDPSVPAAEGCSCLRPLGYRDRINVNS
jgi:hypothetical protein